MTAAVSQTSGSSKNANQAKNLVRITLVRSVAGTRPEHRRTIKALGLRRINSSVEVLDTPSVRGMVRKVEFLVSHVPVLAQNRRR